MKKILSCIAILSIMLFTAACSSTEIAHLNDKQMGEIQKSHKSIILDARKGSKWDDKERVPGARGMSLKSSDAEILSQLPNKKAKIVTYCGSPKCPMSAMLAKRLKDLGYINVSEYTNGIKGWKAAGNKVVIEK